MVVSENSKQNLIKIKPGEVKNPKGRGKGVPNFKTVINKYLQGEMEISINGQITKISPMHAIALGMIKDAAVMEDIIRRGKEAIKAAPIADRHRAAQMLMDRVDGKAVQPLSAVSGSDISLSVTSLEKNDL